MRKKMLFKNGAEKVTRARQIVPPRVTRKPGVAGRIIPIARVVAVGMV